MQYTNHHKRLMLSGIVAAIVGVGAPMAQAAAASPSGPDVPDKIDVEQGNKVFLVGHATGVQIYPCTATAGGYAWGPSTPSATLVDDKGKVVATHFGGPTWRGIDGSSVVGKKVDGVVVDETAIAWLLLRADSSAAGPDGDRLTNTTFIQRTATTGGLPPAAASCNATTVNSTVAVPYTADYHFWKKTGGAS